MTKNGREDGETSARQEGRNQAERYCALPLNVLVQTIHEALARRDAHRYLFFPSPKRQYLEGFISRLQEELQRRVGDEGEFSEFAADALSAPEPHRYELPSVDSIPAMVLEPQVPPPIPPPLRDGREMLFNGLPDEPMPPRGGPANPASGVAGWSAPDLFFAGIPEPEERPRNARPGDNARSALPEEMHGLDSLFSGWTKGLEKLSNELPRQPTTPPPATPSEFPELLLREIPTEPPPRRLAPPSAESSSSPEKDALPPLVLNWNEPPPPRIPLRARIRLAWRKLVDLVHYRPDRIRDWDV